MTFFKAPGAALRHYPAMKAILVLLACLTLAGCLVPNDYRAELTVHRDGRFALSFDGDLVHLAGLRDLASGKADAAQVAATYAEALQEISGIVADTATGPAVHRIALARDGALAEGVTALPGPARFLLIERKDGEALIVTPTFTPHQLKQLKGYGGASRGQVCIRTEAAVLAHNADIAPADPGGCHTWALDLLAGGSVMLRLKL